MKRSTGPKPAKTWLVTFCVRDCYKITLRAGSAQEAIEKAEQLYDSEHEKPFEFDLENGGTCDWDATEVTS